MSRAEVLRFARTRDLEIAYEESGSPAGQAVVLLHGFPYDARAYDHVVPELAAAGCRVVVPYLRGFGPTRFISPDTPRSGQQAAMGQDLLALLDALNISRAVLVGYDWGGRAACIVAALWPERVVGLVSGCGYLIQQIAASATPAAPEIEHLLWYQYYFHTERGRAGLSKHRGEFCRLLWSLWSPTWRVDEATYGRTAASFSNPDFVEIVIHSYRHRFGYASGDPQLADIEEQLAAQPSIAVPAIVLHGRDDGVVPPKEVDTEFHHFAGAYDRRLLQDTGHNLPQEAPHAVVDAVRKLMQLNARGD